MSNFEDLEKRLKNIEDRNKKVETDKAWETSLVRKALLITFTYLSIGFYLNAINIDRPWFNAIVPAFGFFLSTLTLPYIKSFWLKYVKK
ncbi:MAG: hypothetical protein CO135_01125 [Candidatus Levybacteria bacterium CG_4_9_14_3_um_filter_35_16]|nr:MAG: hypothetical protein COW87_03060 [Candidatus Levybacteria bacterium CG22_combo_CG10-13_8_21_14_all_35_11]PIY93882.1 MAG: hypothetical protein COY68_04975 [Candidatus Levybacteria bacterium CG_4_10_14_0_8_um_filter_35_23]PIZ99595.1 MAG: hypothetical protein COX78_01690 [Candidatus Levybacteria bacterium CG_4_10_14_0_2_um_filter_35_8]PJA91468.1 MAG: hypothetical protein CO135_01125 [Candidatus Levybacteria bacterium CG_4_9_14_3_um_filter_35_16]PJC54687.1 MAG: hypothetical protein CO028_00